MALATAGLSIYPQPTEEIRTNAQPPSRSRCSYLARPSRCGLRVKQSTRSERLLQWPTARCLWLLHQQLRAPSAAAVRRLAQQSGGDTDRRNCAMRGWDLQLQRAPLRTRNLFSSRRCGPTSTVSSRRRFQLQTTGRRKET
jgi:hypothetical protein